MKSLIEFIKESSNSYDLYSLIKNLIEGHNFINTKGGIILDEFDKSKEISDLFSNNRYKEVLENSKCKKISSTNLPEDLVQVVWNVDANKDKDKILSLYLIFSEKFLTEYDGYNSLLLHRYSEDKYEISCIHNADPSDEGLKEYKMPTEYYSIPKDLSKKIINLLNSKEIIID